MMPHAWVVPLGRRKVVLCAPALGGSSADVGCTVIPARRGLSSPGCTSLSRLDERAPLFPLRRSAAVRASSAAGPAAGGKAIPQEAARRKRDLAGGGLPGS